MYRKHDIKDVQFVESKGDYGFREVLDDFDNAEYINILTFDISKNGDELINLLKKAGQRGIPITVISNIPQRFDRYFVGDGYDYRKPARKNIKIYERKLNPEDIGILTEVFFMFSNHGKIVMTNNIIYWGSANYSDESKKNYECGVLCKDREFIKYVNEVLFPSITGESLSYYSEEYSICIASIFSFITYLHNKYEELQDASYRGIISSVQKNDLHIIRKIRNRCMHYNVDFKNLPENDLKNHAYKMVSLFKKCLKPMAKDADGSEVFLNSSPKEWTSIKDFVYRNRNVVCKHEKIDMQIRAGVEKLMFTSYYYIGEIDINTEHFKEMTIFDLNCGLPAIIDLTLPQSERIKNLKIQEGNIILASFIATVAETGLTEEWQLLNIHDTYHGVLAPEELDSIMQYFG